ncbi:phospholipase [Erythrobacteraceae bacterium CFH 75059]|uniref:phospholipase D-like domain-containing protein n=1 Tax=Qipengyuania thermophila TaxID=2509361 RepID=UPI00101EFD0E|nr:phospholipase D-like domain-containing protein [Qipengyuania thermophila]TCD05049.1 phospholipase [Erythrobacteraceae bacterium CFH 75059]
MTQDINAAPGRGAGDSVEPGIWRFAVAERASVVIDAADYFAHMQQAMLAARRRIFLIGWDFDPRIHLTRGRRWFQKGLRRTYPSRLGSFFVWLVRKSRTLEIRILKWNVSGLFLAAKPQLWPDLLRWWPHRRIDFKFDSAHPLGCSHHQKIVVLDDRLAACGGIDMTVKRWDDREHRTRSARRRLPGGKPYGPWHDITMMLEGEVAQTLAHLGHTRWERAAGSRLPRIEPREDSLWPEDLPVHFRNVEVGISRTQACFRDWPQVSEIETLFKAHIARARRFIYAESQYFASRAVAEAIIARLQQPEAPEIVIVHPPHADGWLEQQAMDHARAELVRLIEAADHAGRFSLWMPFTDDTAIYVHAKLMIVDDEVIRIGSANMNNRSLGLDSECDLSIDCARPANRGCGEMIGAIRRSLLAEHCDVPESEVAAQLEKAGSMRAFIEDAARREGARRTLRRYVPPELNAVQAKLAESAVLDPERPELMFEPYAQGGLFRTGSRLDRLRKRLRRKAA